MTRFSGVVDLRVSIFIAERTYECLCGRLRNVYLPLAWTLSGICSHRSLFAAESRGHRTSRASGENLFSLLQACTLRRLLYWTVELFLQDKSVICTQA